MYSQKDEFAYIVCAKQTTPSLKVLNGYYFNAWTIVKEVTLCDVLGLSNNKNKSNNDNNNDDDTAISEIGKEQWPILIDPLVLTSQPSTFQLELNYYATSKDVALWEEFFTFLSTERKREVKIAMLHDEKETSDVSALTQTLKHSLSLYEPTEGRTDLPLNSFLINF